MASSSGGSGSSSSFTPSSDIAISVKADDQPQGKSNKRLAALVVLIIPVVGLAILLWWCIRRYRRRQRLRRLRLNSANDNNTDEALTQEMLGMDDSPWLRSTDPSRATAVSALGTNNVAEEANKAGAKEEFDPLYAQAEAQRMRKARRRHRYATIAQAQGTSRDNNAQDKSSSPPPQSLPTATIASSAYNKDDETVQYSPVQLDEKAQEPTTVFASAVRQPTLYAHEEASGGTRREQQSEMTRMAERSSSAALNISANNKAMETGSPNTPLAKRSMTTLPPSSSNVQNYDMHIYNTTAKVLMDKYNEAGKQDGSRTETSTYVDPLKGISTDENHATVVASSRRQESGVFENILSAAAIRDSKLPVAATVTTVAAEKALQQNAEKNQETTTATQSEESEEEEGEYVEETEEATEETRV